MLILWGTSQLVRNLKDINDDKKLIGLLLRSKISLGRVRVQKNNPWQTVTVFTICYYKVQQCHQAFDFSVYYYDVQDDT